MPRTIIEVHVIQTVPPANMNRDDTGSPKTADFGGRRRARVSSQSWKRAMRLYFRENLDASDLGHRTKQVVAMVASRVAGLDPSLEDRARSLTVDAFNDGGVKVKKKGDEIEESGYLVFLSDNQVGNLAAAIAAAAQRGEKVAKKAVKAILDDAHSIDVALFGRMIADDSALNVDAACQVAHAISVHPVVTEFDYFTAVDDQKDQDEEADAGAAMIGTVEFNASTLYRYANLDVDLLRENLGDDAATARAAAVFVEGFVRSMPSGKMNTFANRTLPDAVLVTVRDTQAINLAGAFEQPVSDQHGRIERACELLANQLEAVAGTYGEEPLKVWTVRLGERTKGLAATGEQVGLPALVEAVGALVTERVAERAA